VPARPKFCAILKTWGFIGRPNVFASPQFRILAHHLFGDLHRSWNRRLGGPKKKKQLRRENTTRLLTLSHDDFRSHLQQESHQQLDPNTGFASRRSESEISIIGPYPRKRNNSRLPVRLTVYSTRRPSDEPMLQSDCLVRGSVCFKTRVHKVPRLKQPRTDTRS